MSTTRLLQRLQGWRHDDRWSCLAAYALLLFWCAPLYLSPDTRGSVGSDWEYFLAYFEALRTTLLDHHQFPGYNPWNCLGTPLWANPQIGPLSHYTPLVLLFGTLPGIKLGIVVSYLLSFETARALGRTLFRAPTAAVIAGLLYALNGALAAHLTRGQLSFAAYPWAPLLALYCLRLRHDRWAGARAGAIAGVIVHYGVHYFAVYALFFAALLTSVEALRHRALTHLLRFGALFAASLVAVAAVRLLPMLAVIGDFPRRLAIPLALNGQALWRMFFVPALGPPEPWLQLGRPPHELALGSWEFVAYLGFGVIALSLLSLRRGLRFYHVGALLALALLLGNRDPWHLSRWLGNLPPFDTLWLVFRWRVLLVACLAFAAAAGVDIALQRGPAPGRKRSMGRIVAWALPFELLLLLLPSWAAWVCPYRDVPLPREAAGLPPSDHMLSLNRYLIPGTRNRVLFGMVRSNIGTVQGYEPLFGYGPLKTRRLYAGHPAYRGEYLLDDQAIRPERWSPNRLRFANLPPGSQLEVNLNPGRGWSLNGEPLFEKLQTFAPQQRFVVTVPTSGSVDLRYRPPGLQAGLAAGLLSGLLLLGIGRFARRARPR